jgi:hypothetical protein
MNISGAAEIDDSQISANTESGGAGGQVQLVAGAISLQNGGHILANTDGTGNGGSLFVQGESLRMGQGDSISTVSITQGNSGSIFVNVADAVSMSSTALIEANGVAGAGGSINIQARDLDMTGQSLISANTLGSGAGGQVTINATRISIRGQGFLQPDFGFLQGFTGITAESLGGGSPTSSPGSGGIISVTATDLTLEDGGVISAASYGPSQGGSVTVVCTEGVLANQAQISSTSFQDAGSISIEAGRSFSILNGSTVASSASENGGDISLRVGGLLYLLDSNIQGYAGVKAQPNQPVGGQGGNIRIDPQFVILNGSLISANDLASDGGDGDIANLTNYFFASSSTLHATGAIQTPSPDTELGSKLDALTQNLSDPARRLRENCARSINHEFSTLVATGRGGLENAPDELQPDFGGPAPAGAHP